MSSASCLTNSMKDSFENFDVGLHRVILEFHYEHILVVILLTQA